MVEDTKESETDMHHAEVFDALGHPTRIAILKALNESSLGFAEIKKKIGIKSNGHLQHHINKLNGLIKTDEYGKYCLSDQGKDALLTVGTVENAANPAKKRRLKLNTKKVVGLLLVAIIVTASVSVWAFDRIEAHRRWVKMSSESFALSNNMILTIPLLNDYYNNSGDDQRFALSSQLWAACLSLTALENTELVKENDLALDKIGLFLGKLRDDNLNLTMLSPQERIGLGNAVIGVGGYVAKAYMTLWNYTTAVNSEISFWYTGPSSPDQTYLQQAADYAVNGTQLLN